MADNDLVNNDPPVGHEEDQEDDHDGSYHDLDDEPPPEISNQYNSLVNSIARMRAFVLSPAFDAVDFARCRVRHERITDIWHKLNDLHLFLVNGAPRRIVGLYEASLGQTEEMYIEAISLLRIRLDELAPINPASLAGSDTASISGQVNNGKQVINIKMPVTEIKNTWGMFDGSIMKWKGFHDRFVEDVHGKEEIMPARKFSLLKKSLLGQAANAFGEWELNEAGYAEAWERLKKIYDRKYVICTEHIHQILHLPTLNKPATADELQRMANVTHEQIRGLRANGIPVEHWDMIICVLLHDKLQNETGRQWDLNRSSETPTAKEMLDFLDRQAAALANFTATRPRDPLTITIRNEHARPKESGKKYEQPSTSSGAIKKKFPCEACQGDHPLYLCPDFLALSLNGRWDFVNKRRLCPNCFKIGHDKSNCYSVKCSMRECAHDPAHNSKLCPNKRPSNQAMHLHHEQESSDEDGAWCLERADKKKGTMKSKRDA